MLSLLASRRVSLLGHGHYPGYCHCASADGLNVGSVPKPMELHSFYHASSRLHVDVLSSEDSRCSNGVSCQGNRLTTCLSSRLLWHICHEDPGVSEYRCKVFWMQGLSKSLGRRPYNIKAVSCRRVIEKIAYTKSSGRPTYRVCTLQNEGPSRLFVVGDGPCGQCLTAVL